MVQKNGTYITFHANGTNVSEKLVIKNFDLIKKWTAKDNVKLLMINGQDKLEAVSDSELKEEVKYKIKENLSNSKHVVLIIDETTKYDMEWLPFEIEYAIDTCQIPILIAYLDEEYILDVMKYLKKLPQVLVDRINNGTASCIHIPFKKEPVKDAIFQFSHVKKPKGGGLGLYSEESYKKVGISTR